MNGKAVIFDDISKNGERFSAKEIFKLISLNAAGGKSIIPYASVGVEINGESVLGSGFGNGPIDATFNVIKELVGSKAELVEFSVRAIGKGTDVPGEAEVELKEKGFISIGRGVDSDIITASAKAYINGLNRLEHLKANLV
ncbi:hypothetical protein KKC83_04990 [Patescibacteria group bacterium]|nr:hypothetical protein [Candidatus Falkowbacteria bacterium]MBU3906244.1 hypothetical protein [Patescibacteria group bacterium]MCG2697876.1 hypothetical protein [Candidatus Parcubacteria bacterium]MBU4015696.1 hypothetical protein [Patescibacteria group bacterium]MBU4026873.1 hypothetical protein [Patescibacteria group bacterium]